MGLGSFFQPLDIVKRDSFSITTRRLTFLMRAFKFIICEHHIFVSGPRTCNQTIDSWKFTVFLAVVVRARPDGRVFREPIQRGEELGQRNEEGHELARTAQGIYARDVVPFDRHLHVDDDADIEEDLELSRRHVVVLVVFTPVGF
jgi:hypothetical protein